MYRHDQVKIDEDSSWLSSIINGDRKAQGEFYTIYYDRFLRIARRYEAAINSAGGRVEDVVQDIFIYIFDDSCRVLRLFSEERGVLYAFLSTVAKRRICSYLRMKNRIEQTASVFDESMTDGFSSRRVDPESLCYQRRLWRKLIEHISDEERTLLVKFYLDGHSVDELSVFFGVSAASIHKRISRLRSKARLLSMVD